MVAYSPGLGAFKELNAEVGAHLATHGYVVLTFTPPERFGLQPKIDGPASALEALSAEGEDPTSPLLRRVDASRRAVMGHSQGARPPCSWRRSTLRSTW